MAIIDDIETTFKGVEQIGHNGKALVDALRVIQKKVKWSVDSFEASSQDPTWTETFVAFAGEDSLTYSIEVYKILKETQAKLDALG